MEAIFVGARHGDYDDDYNLSELGRVQMSKLASCIEASNIDNFLVTLLCSTAPRAKQGGEILIKQLAISEERVVLDKCFWDDNFHDGDLCKAESIVKERLCENTLVIVLSHLGYESHLSCYASELLGLKLIYLPPLEYGQGWLVDGRARPRQIP